MSTHLRGVECGQGFGSKAAPFAVARIADTISFFCSGTSRVAENTISVQYAIFASAERESWKDTSRRIRLFAKGSIVLGMAAEHLMLLSSGYNITFEVFTMAREFLALTVVEIYR